MKTVNIQGYKIKYAWKNNNAKHTLLFVHGYNSSSDFAKKIYALKNNFNVLSINFPWNEYVAAKEDLSLTQVAGILYKFIKKTRKKSVYILAHSLGGAITTEMKPLKRVRGFVFLASMHPYMVNTKRYSALLKINQGKRNAYLETSQGKVAKAFSSVFLKTQNLKNEKIKEFSKSFYFFTNPPKGLKKIFYENIWNPEYLQKTLKQNYEKVAKPVWAICGTKDVAIEYKSFCQFMKDTFNVETTLISNAGHNPIRDKPQIVNELLNEFIPFVKKRWFDK